MYNTYASAWAYIASKQTVAGSGVQLQFEHPDDDSF